MVNELEFLLKTHSEEQALSEQCCLRQVLTELRHLADGLGLDFGEALAGSGAISDEPPTVPGFDPGS
jgi:hypothetical protein